MQLRVEADTKKVREALEVYPKKAERATVRALNKAAKSGKTFMARSIAKDMGLRVGYINRSISMKKATVANFFVLLGASLKRIPLIEFKAKPTKRGISYRIGGSRTRLPGAFIATMPGGHRGVFMRKAGVGRLPITERRGPSIGKVFAKYSGEGLARAQEQFVKNLDHELRFAFSEGA